MSNIAYIRVSTVEQNEARQKEALKPYNIDKWYIEKVSGKNTNRPQFKEMIEYIREGDTVYIKDFSRLSRSTADLLKIIETLEKRKITLISLKENIDTSTPTGKLMLTMIVAINEFERTNLLERQREGIEITKKEGKYKGRKAIKKPKQWEAAQAMKKLNLKKNTFYKFAKESNKEFFTPKRVSKEILA